MKSPTVSVSTFLRGLLLVSAISCLTAEAQYPRIPGEYVEGNPNGIKYNVPVIGPTDATEYRPDLWLTYSIYAGNSTLGLGWVLRGLPEISRCPRPSGEYFAGRIVDFTQTDGFCLDGIPLEVIEGRYGEEGAVYTGVNPVIQRVESLGSIGGGPKSFRVRTETRLILEFGFTQDSRELVNSTVGWWHVNRILDGRGNTLQTVRWASDNETRALYPVRIDYKFSENRHPQHSIRFEYSSDRADKFPVYVSGVLRKPAVLLKSIRSYTEEQLYTEYQLNYRPGDAVNVSKLTSIGMCLADDDCALPTKFTWPQVPDQLTFTEIPWPLDLNEPGGIDPGITSGDINGDGIVDILQGVETDLEEERSYVVYHEGTGPGRWTRKRTEIIHDFPPKTIGNMTLEALWVTPKLGEVDGDGFSDLHLDIEGVYRDTNTAATLRYGPIRLFGYLNDQQGGFVKSAALNAEMVSIAAEYFGDFNGDGRDDFILLRPSPNSAVPLLSGDDGGYSYGEPIEGLYAGSILKAGIFNADPCMDILAQGETNRLIFGCDAQDPVELENYAELGYKIVLHDFNGDDKTDLFLAHATRPSLLKLFSGSQFVDTDFTSPPGWANYQVKAGDFNADGRKDLVLIAASTTGENFGAPIPHEVHLSTGDGFVKAGEIPNKASAYTFAVPLEFDSKGAYDIWIKKAGISNTLYATDFHPIAISVFNNGVDEPFVARYSTGR